MPHIVRHLSLCVLLFIFIKAGSAENIKYKIDSVSNLSFVQITSDPEKSLSSLLFYLSQAEKINYTKGLAALSSKLGFSYYILGKYEKSTEYRLQAIRLFEKLNYREYLGNEYCGLGYGMKRRDLSKAFAFMHTGINILEKEQSKRGLADNYNNYGVLYEMRGSIDSAIYYYKVSIKLKKELNDSVGISYSLNNIFQTMLIKKQSNAINYLDSSMQIRKNLNDPFAITENYALYGDYYFEFKNYKKAIEYFIQVLQRASEHKYTYLVQYSSNRLQESYEALGQFKEAMKYYKIYVQYKDSLSNAETNKSIAALEIQFESEKKEKEIAQQKVRLANAELKVKKRNYLLFGLVFLLGFSAFGGWYVYKQQKFKQEKLMQEALLKDQIANITLTNKLQEERLRISRDLHDNIGSQLTFIISALDNVSFLLKNADEAIVNRIKQISLFTSDTIAQLRDTIWAMNMKQITSEDLKSRIINYISKLDMPVSPTINFNDNLSSGVTYKSIQGMNIFRVIQEATNNALKHANASEISIDFKETKQKLSVSIIDNGKGYHPDHVIKGNGLINMKKRIEDINGELNIESKPGMGTTILFNAPLENKA